MRFLLCVLTICLLFSCKKTIKVDDTTLARVGDEFLYMSDIQRCMPGGFSKTDSISFIEAYVQKWVRDKLMYQKASINLPSNQEDIEEKVEEYRQSLNVYKYEQSLITKKLDSKVPEEEIKEYYKNHQSELMLSESYVKPFFVQFPKKVGKQAKILPFFKSNKEADIDKIKDFCYQYSNKFYFGEKWMSEDELSQLLPPNNCNFKNIYNSKQVVQLEDSLCFYIFKIDDLMEMGGKAPYDIAENAIKQIIIQKRTLEVSKTIRNKIFEEALRNNEFEIYKR